MQRLDSVNICEYAITLHLSSLLVYPFFSFSNATLPFPRYTQKWRANGNPRASLP
jgi:hypothetical protein